MGTRHHTRSIYVVAEVAVTKERTGEHGYLGHLLFYRSKDQSVDHTNNGTNDMSLIRTLALRRGSTYQPNRVLSIHRWASSTNSQADSNKTDTKQSDSAKRKATIEKLKEAHKSVAASDEEMRSIMEGLSGDGGAAGAELEDGKPVAMKRSVKENMFRYI